MKKTLNLGILMAAVVAGSALAGCMKDPDPPKLESANSTNTQGHTPGKVSGAGGSAQTPSTQ
jgi:hypothetical protein